MFLTGSVVYGSWFNEQSDIDVVTLVDDDTLKVLLRFFQYTDEERGDYDTTVSANIRVGRLNLICVADQGLYDVWKRGTEELKLKSLSGEKFDRAYAVEHLTKMREDYFRKPGASWKG